MRLQVDDSGVSSEPVDNNLTRQMRQMSTSDLSAIRVVVVLLQSLIHVIQECWSCETDLATAHLARIEVLIGRVV